MSRFMPFEVNNSVQLSKKKEEWKCSFCMLITTKQNISLQQMEYCAACLLIDKGRDRGMGSLTLTTWTCPSSPIRWNWTC